MPKLTSNIDMVQPLKYWRMKRGFSQSKLASVTGTSALTIGQLESGRRRARGATLAKILQGLGVTQDEFFGMREGHMAAAIAPAVVAPPAEPIQVAKTPTPAAKEPGTLRLSNLDLELLNRILNLDFDGKVQVLKFLQNLGQ